MVDLGPGGGETSGTGGSFGGGDDYTSFKQSYERHGFMSKMSSISSALGNISKFDQDVGKLVGSGGTIAKLQSALEALTARLNKVGIGGRGTAVAAPGLAAATSAGGVMLGTNPATFTSGQTPWQQGTPNGGTQQTGPPGGPGGNQPVNSHHFGVYAAGAFAVGTAANVVESRMGRSVGMAPAATALQMPGGLTYRQVNETLSNRGLSYGTTGGADTLAAAGQAQYLSGRAMLAPGGRVDPTFRNTMGAMSTIALTNPGMSLSEAGGMYASLRTPRVNWWGTGLGLPTFTGRGRTSPDFAGTATSYLQALVPGSTAAQRADPRFLQAQFTGNQSAAAAGRMLLGGDEQLQTVLHTAMANLQYRSKTGGRGDIFADIQNDKTGKYIDQMSGQFTDAGRKRYRKEAVMGGYGNAVMGEMQEQQSLDAKNTLAFSASQETNIARSLGVQKEIKNLLERIARTMGAAGPVLGPVSQVTSAFKNPVTDLALASLLSRGGAGSAASQAAARIGIPAGTGLAAGLGGMGGGITGGIAGHLIQSKVHGAGGRALGALGGAATGAATGALIGSILPGPGTAVGAVLGGIGGGIAGLIGDAPMGTGFITPHLPRGGVGDASSSDIKLLQSRNASVSGPGGITGLNPQFRHDLARMFRDNPRLVLNSGYRDPALQKRLYEHYKKYGGAEVAPPGHSMHEKGLAADIGPKSQEGWLHSHGGKYGIVNYTAEPWHWELAGASNAGNRSNYGVAPDAAAGQGGLGVGAGSGASASTAGKSTSISGGIGGGGMSSGNLFSGGNLMKSLVGAGTQAGAPIFIGTSARGPGGVGGDEGGQASTGAAGGAGAGAGKPIAPSKSVQDYINLILPHVRRAGGRYGIPASVMLAQSGIETGWGTSNWWKSQKNPAGIGVTGAAGAGSGFASIAAAFNDYANKLMGHGEAGQDAFVADVKRHAPALQLLKDLEASPWAAGHYGGHGLENVYKQYGLGKYDGGVGDAPSAMAAIAQPSIGSRDALAMLNAAARGRGGNVQAAATHVHVGGGGGRPPIHANFNVNVRAATQTEAENFAQYAWKRLKQLDEQEAQRSN